VLADGDDVITGGSVPLASLLAPRPVALLVRHS